MAGRHGERRTAPSAMVLPAATFMLLLAGLQCLLVAAAQCPQPCLSGVCDDVTGTCVVDWGSGFDGASQGTPVGGCPRGVFGADCTEACSVNCVDSQCRQDTGDCTLGCKAGFTGNDCTTVCINGFYGANCAVPCPQHCRNHTCSPHSGVCSDGCQEGYWGSDCSLGMELSRSSPDDRRSFYSKLSAEGKSVLLYLLTSRYDQALARAQFEIERAVQDRNEIQRLLHD
ncbi:uncharacterized protein LOC143275934 isoform X2 [Babylonia areolata]|uniref:uncharacterized protein LOC143275934 isoform X2 n=1 Tax=Babylonia areolata TaxID=304850 RepID=UPI003FD106FB